jgi:hypothetical protein
MHAALTLAWESRGAVVIALAGQHGYLAWGDLVGAVVRAALDGHTALVIAHDPPAWDLEPSAVSDVGLARRLDGEAYLLLPVSPENEAGLAEALASTDFRLGTLWITTLPLTDLPRVEALVAAIHRSRSVAPVETRELLIRCSDDTRLRLTIPDAATLAYVRTATAMIANRHSWELLDRTGAAPGAPAA